MGNATLKVFLLTLLLACTNTTIHDEEEIPIFLVYISIQRRTEFSFDF